MKNRIFKLSLATLLVCLSACRTLPTGLNPDNALATQTSMRLATAQLEHNRVQAASLSGARLWYVGLGMHSGSHAFRGDVTLTHERMRALDVHSIVYTFDNELQQTQLQSPFAHLGSLEHAVQEIAALARPDDLAVVMLSSHGHKKILAVDIGGKAYTPIHVSHLRTALRPLKDTSTVLIISACFSGSLIPELKNPNWVILTASADDRESHGCQPLSNNSFFINALFGQGFDAQQTLAQAFTAAKQRVTKAEEAQKLKPSLPQIEIGEKMRAFMQKPMQTWFVAGKNK